MDYQSFIASKNRTRSLFGFKPVWLPAFLYPFQREITEWSIRKGRSAVFADCGL